MPELTLDKSYRDRQEIVARAEVLASAIKGVEEAQRIGYAIHKTSDVAMHVLRQLEKDGYEIRKVQL